MIKTSPVKRILMYLFTCVVVFVLTTFFLADKTYFWVINILIFSVCFLFIVFEKDSIIVCDQNGCTVKEKRFWQSSGESYSFRWNEVSETEYYADTDTSRAFYVEINSVKRKILTSNFSFDDTDYFIETVNQATPHLPYIWERNEGVVASAFEARRYTKVGR